MINDCGFRIYKQLEEGVRRGGAGGGARGGSVRQVGARRSYEAMAT